MESITQMPATCENFSAYRFLIFLKNSLVFIASSRKSTHCLHSPFLAYTRRILFTLILGVTVISGWAQNATVTENARPGTPQSIWQIQGAGDLSIQGYATDISYNKGETARF